jgi:acetyl esterase/lipase
MQVIPGRVEVEEGVVFGRGGGRDLRCDVYTPPGGVPSNAPGLLIVHGGGWRDGDRTQLRGYAIRMARLGFVCVANEYRLLGESPWPAMIHDTKAALRWMRANHARLGVDPDRISVTGNSAGGHLSLLVAATPNLPEFEGDGGNPGVSTAVKAAIGFYPVTDFLDAAGKPTVAPFLFGDRPQAEVARAASPITYVRADFPPTLFIHGNKDTVVDVGQSTSMYDALQRAGVPAELHVFAEQPHAFDAALPFARVCVEEMALFLERYVVAPAAAPATA